MQRYNLCKTSDGRQVDELCETSKIRRHIDVLESQNLISCRRLADVRKWLQKSDDWLVYV